MTILTRSAQAPPMTEVSGFDIGRRARLDAAVRVASVGVPWLSLSLVTYWWVADGEAQDFAGWASELISFGRLTGLVASVLLLAQVVLMASVSPLERVKGK